MLVEQNTLINSDSNITKLKQSMNDDSNQMLPYIKKIKILLNP